MLASMQTEQCGVHVGSQATVSEPGPRSSSLFTGVDRLSSEHEGAACTLHSDERLSCVVQSSLSLVLMIGALYESQAALYQGKEIAGNVPNLVL